MIKETPKLDDLIRYSIKCYDYRAMDVDVFLRSNDKSCMGEEIAKWTE